MSIKVNLEYPRRFFIGGNWVEPNRLQTHDVINCATEEVIETIAIANEIDVELSVAAAREAFDNGPWPRMSHAERATYLRALADELDNISHQNSVTWTAESGVIFSASNSQMNLLGNKYRYYADLAEKFKFQEINKAKYSDGYAILRREAIGVVAAIVPWNSPAVLTANKVAPALIAGCSVIIKASPEAPCSAYLLAEACKKIGLPPGVLNVLVADRLVSERLVRHDGVDKVSFTGSTQAGLKIASICGERMARYTLELGGKSPAVILDDYDIEKAANSIASRAIFLTGQVCSSLTRIIVSRHRHDDLVDAISARFRNIKVGNPFDKEIQMGPLASEIHRNRVESYIAKGISQGARLATGGKRPMDLDKGFFIEPTVFANVDNSSVVGSEEIFGPVLSIMPAKNEKDAIDIANATEYGLNASVFTSDVDRAFEVAKNIRSGAVGHNSVRREYDLPSGGFKKSGVGREGGVEGLLGYLETKVIILEGIPDLN